MTLFDRLQDTVLHQNLASACVDFYQQQHELVAACRGFQDSHDAIRCLMRYKDQKSVCARVFVNVKQAQTT